MLVGSYEFGDRHFRTDFSGKLVAIGRDCRRKKYGKVLSREGSKGVDGNKLFRLGSWGARWPFPFSRRPLQSELIYSSSVETPLATTQGVEVEEWLHGQTPMVFEAMNESHLPYAILSSSQEIRSSDSQTFIPKQLRLPRSIFVDGLCTIFGAAAGVMDSCHANVKCRTVAHANNALLFIFVSTMQKKTYTSSSNHGYQEGHR
jgi:hypothetical protein